LQRDLPRYQKNNYDLLVIGGGINGASIAHLAALRRMKVALLEKNDFAAGTSSKSSKLMHGGIRYLERFEFGLVRESLRERYFHVQAAPHLVRPLAFIIPVYEGDRRPLWMMRLGVFLYDLLAGSQKIGQHRFLSRDDLLKHEPNLKSEGLTGGVLYYDAQMDDARVCLENVLAADAHGAHVANYVEVTAFIKENGRVTGVRARDRLAPEKPEFEIRARNFFCAAGPWTNALLKLDEPHAPEKVRPTKGVHIVTPKKICKHAFLIPAERDNRIFFVLPWKNNSMIGTTDTDYSGSPDQVAPEEADIAYLIEETRRVFPGLELHREDFKVSFAGLRPLLKREGSASNVSREHAVFTTASGLFFVAGGKFTSYRSIAEDCVDRIRPNSMVKIEALYGSGRIDEEGLPRTAREHGVSLELIQGLVEKYGARYTDLLKLGKENPALFEAVSPGLPLIKAELVYAVRTEMARSVDDLLYRRLSLGYSPAELEPHREDLLKAIHEVCAL